MSSGDESGDPRSVSPSDQPGQALDAGTNQPDTAAVPVGSTPPPSSEPSTAPPAASGAPAPAKTDAKPAPDDPVAAAIARLAREPGDKPRDEQGRFAPQDARAPGTPAKKPDQPAAGAAPAKPAAPAVPATTPGVDTDPYHGFDERDRAALKGKTRDRIEELNRRWHEAETRAEAASKSTQVDEFTELVQKHKLDEDVGFVAPDNLAALVRTEAAITRSMIALRQGRRPAPGDVQVAGQFLERIDSVRGHLGLTAKATAAADIVPFAGALPDEGKDMVELYGVPEADVRMLLAIKARKAAGPAQGRESSAAPPIAPAQAPDPQGNAPTGIDWDALYSQRLVVDVTRDGVQPAMVQAHYQVLLPVAAAITQRRFPGLPQDRIAAVFDALPAQERYNILSEAHREHQAKSRPVTSPSRTTPPPPASAPSLNGGPLRRAAPSANGDPVAEAIAHLARR